MSLTFLQLCEQVILEESRPLRPIEIWEISQKKGYSKPTKSLSPETTISSRIYDSISNDPYSPFIRIDSKPITYSHRDLQPDICEVYDEENEIKSSHERNLHHIVTYQQLIYEQTYTKTIRHERSKKKRLNRNKWLHPDMVGLKFEMKGWDTQTARVCQMMGDAPVKLVAYEVKKEPLNWGNMHRFIWQAQNACSWAHCGILCAFEIESDVEFTNELHRLLCASGLGLIKLEKNPDDSQVIVEPRVKEKLDYTTMSKLSETNKDFREYLNAIWSSIQVQSVQKDSFEAVMDVEDIQNQIN
jgi:hypothetical protein